MSEQVMQNAYKDSVSRPAIKLLATLFVFFAVSLGHGSAVFASLDFEAMKQLTPGEKYRQLSLLLLVAGGVQPELTAFVEEAGVTMEMPDLELDDYQKPLARIVDQDSMLLGAARMFHFARQHELEIKAMLAEIAQENPILISLVDVNELAEEAIIIRTAIADSIEYSELQKSDETVEELEAFRLQTVRLRNMMEYNIFREDLAAITDEAIVDLGGRLDAYQRMFDEDIEGDMVEQRIAAAETMNQQTDATFDERARARTNELLMMLILMESQVSH
jgi:hypothetical protein